jgi:hypothetical protein
VLLAPSAVAGLGSTGGRSLQQEFDGCVACLGAVAAACGSAAGVLAQVMELVQGGGGGAGGGDAALEQIRGLLGRRCHSRAFDDGGGGKVDVLELLSGGAAAVEARLAAWRGLARSHQAPSRVLRWAIE